MKEAAVSGKVKDVKSGAGGRPSLKRAKVRYSRPETG